jgi:hypothetical protein
METMLRSDIEQESQQVRLNNVKADDDNSITEADLDALGRRIGLVPMGADNGEN